MAEALGDPLSPSPASERVARFDVDPPPGTMSLVGEVTHVPRLAADHLRHAVLTGSGAVDLASKLGGLSENVAGAAVGGLNIGVGSLLVVGVLPNLASKLALLCSYKKRLNILKEEKEAKQKAIDEAKKKLEEPAPEPVRDATAKRIIYLRRELDRCDEAYRALKESRFRMATAANNILEVSAGAVRIARFAGSFTGTITGATATALKFVIPGLGIVTGGFWAVFGVVMGRKAWRAQREAQAELQQCEAEIFLSDERNRSRCREFLKDLPLTSQSPTFRNKLALQVLVQAEYKKQLEAFEASAEGQSLKAAKEALAELERQMKLPDRLASLAEDKRQLVAQIAELEAKRPRPIPITLETIGKFREEKPLASSVKCAALRKAFLEKKIAVLTQERRKQIVKFCHYALLVGVGVLGVAAGALAIGATAGAATPAVAAALLGLFVIMVPVGGGILGTDIAIIIFDRIKGHEERKIPKTLAAAQLAKELGALPDEDRRSALKAVGFSEDLDEEGILAQLTPLSQAKIEQLANVLYGQMKEGQRDRMLRAVGLDLRVSPSAMLTEYIAALAKDLAKLPLDKQQEALLSLDALPTEGLTSAMSEPQLLDHLTSRLSLLFPKDEGEEARHLLSSYGIDEFLTAQDLADKILKLDTSEELLGKMGMTGVVPDRLAKQLQKRFPYLFPQQT